MKLPLDPRTLVRAAAPGALDLFTVRCSLLTRAAVTLRTLSALPLLPVREARRPDDTGTGPSTAPPSRSD